MTVFKSPFCRFHQKKKIINFQIICAGSLVPRPQITAPAHAISASMPVVSNLLALELDRIEVVLPNQLQKIHHWNDVQWRKGSQDLGKGPIILWASQFSHRNSFTSCRCRVAKGTENLPGFPWWFTHETLHQMRDQSSSHAHRFRVIPKAIPENWRLILDLSFPEGASINDGISETCATYS